MDSLATRHTPQSHPEPNTQPNHRPPKTKHMQKQMLGLDDHPQRKLPLREEPGVVCVVPPGAGPRGLAARAGRGERGTEGAPGADDARPNVLALQGVLHLPDASCNGLSLPRYRGANGLVGITGMKKGEADVGSETETGERGRGGVLQARSEVDGERLWYGDEYCGWSRVVLWGDPRGETYLGQEPEGSMLGVVASAEELDKLFTRVKERSLV
ncbi:hypothetical protein ARAM_002701 [Aspergillus rambellii]|uniref:Uncharacterized protein n=1 Tax=Aspergillus rambellii TaxID=308745 RepID=A0A0F8UN23_9EURO|nr:hypothetical protein ARAM_002701 [Aspergillus rambellii]